MVKQKSPYLKINSMQSLHDYLQWPEEISFSVWFFKLNLPFFWCRNTCLKEVKLLVFFLFGLAQLGHGRMEWVSQCERNSRLEKWKMSVGDLGVGSESMTWKGNLGLISVLSRRSFSSIDHCPRLKSSFLWFTIFILVFLWSCLTLF